MKQNLKKMLLALMVGIGMMGVVSAQAQTQEKVYVKVSDFYNLYISDEGVTGTVDQLCDAHVNAYDASYKYTGLWSWMGDRDIRCGVSTPTPSSTVGLQMRVHCLKGGSINQNLVGCYEELDKCPDGTVNEGGVCVEPEDTCKDNEEMIEGECFTKCPSGQVRQEDKSCGCPEGQEFVLGKCIPVNDERCDIADYKKTEWGGVFCDNDSDLSICLWRERYSNNGYNSEEVYQCGIAHEKAHIEHARGIDRDKYTCSSSRFGVDAKDSNATQAELAATEILARYAEYTCLKGKLDNCQTENCRAEVNRRSNQIIREMGIYAKQYDFYKR